MESDLDQKLAACKELILHLEHENKIKDNIIQTQEEIIATLESHNNELQKLIQEMLMQ